MSKYEGGPAFPSEQGKVDGVWNQTYEPGMKLRDYFAGQALNGLIAHHGCERQYSEFAENSYRFADAMITYLRGEVL